MQAGNFAGTTSIERFINGMDALRAARLRDIRFDRAPANRPARVLAEGDADGGWEIAEIPHNELDSPRTWSPDPNTTEDWGRAFGISYAEGEVLQCGEKERDRDRHRWELDPASADDYGERLRDRSC